MKKYHSFNFLKKIYFERLGGSDNELKAASLIKEEVEFLGENAIIEDFEVDGYTLKESKLTLENPHMEIECKGSGYYLNTPKEGVSGEFAFITSLADLEMTNLKDKIVLLVQKRPNHKYYMKALKDGAKGLITVTGSVYKNAKEVDLDPYISREIDYKEGKLPVVMIRAKDAERIVEKMPKTATLVLQTEDYKTNSRNVICEIKGSVYPNEIVTFSAHYDSVMYSKGVYDNATGATTLLQLIDYYHNHKPKRTCKFIFCGSEENGLLGSKAYCKDHEKELESIVANINIDMTGVTLGYDYCCVTGENDIVHNIEYKSKIVGFPIIVKQGVYSSDSTPFADKGIPAMSFARLPLAGGAVIHSHDDVIERLSETNYMKTCEFIAIVTSDWVNASTFPIKKIIPDNMKDELDYYNQRKERPTK